MLNKKYGADLRWRKNFSKQEKKNCSFHLLDIPAELAFIYSKVDAWEQVHTEKNILKLVENNDEHRVCRILDNNLQLPADINSFSFNKFIQIYIKVN